MHYKGDLLKNFLNFSLKYGKSLWYDLKQDYWAGVGEKLPWNAWPGSSVRVGGISRKSITTMWSVLPSSPRNRACSDDECQWLQQLSGTIDLRPHCCYPFPEGQRSWTKVDTLDGWMGFRTKLGNWRASDQRALDSLVNMLSLLSAWKMVTWFWISEPWRPE